MVKLKKKEVKNNIAEYYYQPEKKGEFGLISYDYEKDSISVIELAEGDKKGSMFYVGPCYAALVKCFEKNEFPEEIMRHWY